jgi:two-component system cell cycle response regulator
VTLRLRLSLAFLLVVVAPLLVAAVVVGRGVPQALDSAADNRLAASRAGAVAIVDQTCARVGLAVEVLAREATSAAGGGQSSLAVPASVAARDVVRRQLVDYAVVSDSTGTVVARAGRLPTAVQPPPSGLGSCSRGTPAPVTVAAIADTVAVRASTGRPLGAAAGAVSLDSAMARRLAAATNASVTLVAGDVVIASTESPAVARQLARSVRQRPTARVLTVGSRLATAAPVGPGQSVVLSVSRPRESNLQVLLASVIVAGVLLAAAIGWWLARITTRPLAELSEAAARVAAGDLDTKIETTSRDEIGRLAHAFNEMTDELRTYVGELESSRDELRGNLARLGDTLSSTHDLGRILTVILDTAIGSVRATAGAAYVLQRDELQLRAGRGLERRAAGSRVRTGEGVTGSVAETGEAVRGRVGADGLRLAPAEPTADELISVPMRASGGVLGVLNLYDRADGRPFDAGDLATIRTFAGQAAVALDNVLLHQEAQRLSVTDALTGLGNYRFFQTMLARETERAARFNRELAVLMLDLDRFKLVNDVHGHQAGDSVLAEVAQRVRAQVREVDVVARYGGEEFVVVLPETGSEGAGHTADRICAAVRQTPVSAAGLQIPITASIGVAVFPVHGDSPATLVRSADEALYAAKAEGRDRWRMSGEPTGGGAR